MKKKVLCTILSLAMVLSYSFSTSVFAGTTKLKNIKIVEKQTFYDLVDGVKITWKGVKGAEKYRIMKNAKNIKTIKATKKNNTYTYTYLDNDTSFDNDKYSVAAIKTVKQKQYYNKKTKKWQKSKPLKKNRGKSRCKKIQKVFATSVTMPIKINSGQNGGNGNATHINYYTDSKSNITGYKSFFLNGRKYTDISNNEDVEIGNDMSFWKNYINTSKLPDGRTIQRAWADVADVVFKTQNNYRTHYPKYEDEYREYKNRLYIPRDLSLLNEVKRGDKSRTNSMSSGLLEGSSFSEVRDKMGSQVKSRIDHGALDRESSKILSNAGLDILNDTTQRNLLYIVGTNIKELTARYSNKYSYSSNAIIFYDFALEPIIDANLEEVSDIAMYKNLEEAAKNTNKVKIKDTDTIVYADNDSITEGTVTVSTGTSTSTSMSTTISNSKSTNFTESLSLTIGTDLGISSALTQKQSLTYGLTWGEAFTSAQSDGKTITKTTNGSSSLTQRIPPQTTVQVTQSDGEVKATYAFKTPMKITYKVCIASLAGEVYADDALTCDFKSYDQGAFATFFGRGGNNGDDAIDSLYKRASMNHSNDSYDKLYGGVYAYENKSLKPNQGVNWKAYYDEYFLEKETDPRLENLLDSLASNYSMLSNGGTTSITSNVTTYSSGKTIPLYKLAGVIVSRDKLNYDQSVDISLNENYVINNRIKLLAFNTNGVEYAGFMQGAGYWVACDENGKEISASDNDLFEITSTNILKPKKSGNGFITYRLSNEAKNIYVSKEGGKSVNPGDSHGNGDVVVGMPIVSVHIG